MSTLLQLSSPGALTLLLTMLLAVCTLKESQSAYTVLPDTTTMSPVNSLPYFDFDVPRNVTVTVGQTGFLHCRVERLADKDVSWIRKRDLHILTAGSITYTSDQRFQVIRPESSANWTLQIKYPQPRDSGVYECQINTEPKMSLSYTFNVVELRAEIVGPSDLYVKSGSDINLTCRISQGPHELGNIFWYKGSEMLDMTITHNKIDDSPRITVDYDWSDGLTSRLKIRRAMPSDTGNYTCVPTVAKASSVYVHVIIGEHPAAMQHNSSSMNNSNFYCIICCMLFTLFTCCMHHLLLPSSLFTSGQTSTKATASMALKAGPLTDTNTLRIPPMLEYRQKILEALANEAVAAFAALKQQFNQLFTASQKHQGLAKASSGSLVAEVTVQQQLQGLKS